MLTNPGTGTVSPDVVREAVEPQAAGETYRLSELQVKAILELRLHRLTALGRDEIGWLGFARIAMGYPLWIVGIGLSVLIVMRGTGWKRPPLRTLLGKK